MNIFAKNKKAFTIIELIIVIAIIGILVLFGMPKLMGYIQKAKLARIQHDVKVMETMMDEELTTNINKNFETFVDNGKDLGLLIEANRLFEKEGHADNLQYVPIKGEIDGLNYDIAENIESNILLANSSNEPVENLTLGMGGPKTEENEEFKEIYERYKIIPEIYKSKAGSKLKGTFYSNPNGKVYYEPDKSIGLKKEIKPMACSSFPEPDYTFEHEIGKIVKYHGNAEHLVIPDYFLVNGKCWPVRIIGEGAFMQGDFKSIIIPGTVITIEGNAFKDLELETIYIPGSVTTIHPGAFDGNYEVIYGGPSSSLNGGRGGSHTYPGGGEGSYKYKTPSARQAGVVFNPGSNTIVKGNSRNTYIPPYINVNGIDYPVKKVAKGAYQGLGLITVILPETLEIIEDYAFSGNQLIGIRIPHSVKHIGNYAFAFNEQWKVGNITGRERIATIKTILIKEEEQFEKVDKLGNILDEDELKINLYKSPIIEEKQLGPDVKLLNHIWVTSINNIVIDVKYGPVGSGEEDIPKGYEMAELEDFKFVLDSNAPGVYHDNQGYYQYVGTKEYVVIPHIIQDTKLTDYYKMFAGTNVKGIASNNKKISDMSYMLQGIKVDKIELKHLDTSQVTNMIGMFAQTKFDELDIKHLDTSAVTNMSAMFLNADINIIDLLTFDTSNVTNMSSMFQDAISENIILTNFNTSSVVDMSNMFLATQTTTLDLSNFDVSKAKLGTMFSQHKGYNRYENYTTAKIGYARTEADATKLNSVNGKPTYLTFVVKDDLTKPQPNTKIPVGYKLAKQEDFQFVIDDTAPHIYNGVKGYYKYIGIDEKVVIPYLINGNEMKDYYGMFINSKSIKGVASDNKQIINMSRMFQNTNADNIELKYLDTSAVTNMYAMFFNADISIIDLLTFDTSNVTNMSSMFQDAISENIILTNFNTSSVVDMSQMFLATQTTTLDLSNFDVSKAKLGTMFSQHKGYNRYENYTTAKIGYARTEADVTKLNSVNGKPAYLTFVVKDHLTKPQPNTKIPVGYKLAKQEDFQFIIDDTAPHIYNGVKGYYKYIGIDEKIVIPHLINGNEMKDYYGMFINSKSIKGVASDNKQIINMSRMFQNTNANNIELKYLDTSAVTNMYAMFFNADINIIDLLTFDTSNVTNMSSMFQSTISENIILTSFNTSSVVNMSQMFRHTRTTTLDLSSFDVSKANLSNMFSEGYRGENTTATVGYARTEVDATKLNSVKYKPVYLTFVVKP